MAELACLCTHTRMHPRTHTHVCLAPRLVPSRLCFWTHENDSLRKDGSPELPPHLLLEQKYLIEGLVGVRVTEAEWGFLPELFSELMLLELREDHVRRSGSRPRARLRWVLHPGPPPRPRYLELLALPPQDADLVGLQGRHVLLHLDGQLLGVRPLFRQLLCRQRPRTTPFSALFKKPSSVRSLRTHGEMQKYHREGLPWSSSG